MRLRLGGNGASANAAATATRRRLRTALAIDEAERPVVDRMTAAPPFVGPGERDRAARAFLERRADVHRGDRGLARFALANAVGARLGEQQRLVAGDVLQPREVRAQLGLAMQVDVERADVEERQIEELGRRKVDVREQAVGRRGLRRPGRGRGGNARRGRGRASGRRPAESRCRARRSAPPDGRRARDLPDDVAAGWSRVSRRSSRNATCCDQGSPTMTRSPWRAASSSRSRPRRRVGADRVDAEARHQAEVFGDLLRRGELVAVGVGRERAVRHALDEKALVAAIASALGASA